MEWRQLELRIAVPLATSSRIDPQFADAQQTQPRRWRRQRWHRTDRRHQSPPRQPRRLLDQRPRLLVDLRLS
jgi:hypothetical protein